MDGKQLIWIFLVCHVCESLAQKCPKIEIQGGVSRIRRDFRFVITYKCHKNLELIGRNSAVCLRSGEWSSEPPVCAAKTCQKPPGSAHVQVTEQHEGAVLRFSCDTGLTRSGPEMIWCNGTTWSDTAPACIPTTSDECDFEHKNLCGWSNDLNDEIDWLINQGKTPTSGTGPQVDHTTNSSSGHYLYIEASGRTRNGYSARLRSPDYTPEETADMCVEFYYHMFGVGMGRLEVLQETLPENNSTRIFRLQGNQGNQWHHAIVEVVQQPYNSRLVFQAIRLSSFRSDIALDDIHVAINCHGETTTHAIASTKEATLAVSTTSQATTTRTTRGFNSPQPTMSSSREPGATEENKEQEVTESVTIKFKENQQMRTKDGCKKVELDGGDSMITNKGRMIQYTCHRSFRMIGLRYSICTSSDHWGHPPPICAATTCQTPPDLSNVVVSKQHGGAVLRLSCTAGMIRQGPEMIWCTGRNWNDTTARCVVGASRGCDFEDEYLCGWSNDIHDDFDWYRGYGDTPDSETGPQADHTTNSSLGHYMYIEASRPVRKGHRARLFSPIFTRDDMAGMCVEFYYHMYGRGTGSLDVYVETLPESTQTRIFHRQGDQGNQWQRFSADIYPQSRELRLVFEAKRNQSLLSDIAIDDISLYKCRNETTPSIRSTTTANNMGRSGSPVMSETAIKMPGKTTPLAKPVFMSTSPAKSTSWASVTPSIEMTSHKIKAATTLSTSTTTTAMPASPTFHLKTTTGTRGLDPTPSIDMRTTTTGSKASASHGQAVTRPHTSKLRNTAMSKPSHPPVPSNIADNDKMQDRSSSTPSDQNVDNYKTQDQAVQIPPTNNTDSDKTHSQSSNTAPITNDDKTQNQSLSSPSINNVEKDKTQAQSPNIPPIENADNRKSQNQSSNIPAIKNDDHNQSSDISPFMHVDRDKTVDQSSNLPSIKNTDNDETPDQSSNNQPLENINNDKTPDQSSSSPPLENPDNDNTPDQSSNIPPMENNDDGKTPYISSTFPSIKNTDYNKIPDQSSNSPPLENPDNDKTPAQSFTIPPMENTDNNKTPDQSSSIPTLENDKTQEQPPISTSVENSAKNSTTEENASGDIDTDPVLTDEGKGKNSLSKQEVTYILVGVMAVVLLGVISVPLLIWMCTNERQKVSSTDECELIMEIFGEHRDKVEDKTTFK